MLFNKNLFKTNNDNGKYLTIQNLSDCWKRILACGVICFFTGSIQAQINENDGEWLATNGAGDWAEQDGWVDREIAYGAGRIATLTGTTGVVLTLSEPITIGTIQTSGLVGSTTSLWTIGSGGTLTLATNSEDDRPLFDLVSSSTHTALTIYSVLAGTQGFEKKGSGRLVLRNGNNTFTGGILASGGHVYSLNANTLNNNTITLAGGGWIMYGTNTTNAAYTNDVVLAATSTIINLGAGSTTPDVFSLSGVISETGGTRTLRITSNGGNQHIRLLGNNSYTGDTYIGSSGSVGVVIRAEHNNAFGQGDAAVILNGGTKASDLDAVELANNVTISNKTFDFRGKGRDAAGSLRSISGNNTWEGNISTGSYVGEVGGIDATVGVDADQLTLSGVISGTSDGGLTKVGEGTLVLTNDNTYTNGTTVNAGTVRVEHNNALAGGALTLGDGAGTDTLNIASGVALNVTNLTLTSSSNFVFELNGIFDATQVNVSGNQLGNTTYTVDILDNGIVEGMYTLLQVTGSYGATDFVLGTPHANYSLDWTEGTLYLNVIPEPSALILLGLGLSASVMQRSRRKNG